MESGANPWFEIRVHLGQLGLAFQRGMHGEGGVALLCERGVPEGDDGVALIFIHRAPMGIDDVGHGGEIVIEEGGQLLRVESFGDGGEALDVGEENG